MKLLRILIPVLLVAGIARADVLTLDPPDVRLNNKVSLEVIHTKLEDVARSLTEQSGVAIKAGSGERDWRVRERRVTIIAKDVTLGALMVEISRLLGFYLSREGRKDEWSYLFWQDAKSRMLESEMLNAQKEAEAQRVTRIRQRALDEAGEALKMTPEEAAKLRDKNPWLAYLGSTKAGRATAQLLSMFDGLPTERDLMLRGRRVVIPISSLPADLRQAALDTTTGGIVAAQNKVAGIDTNSLTPHQIVILPVDDIGERAIGLLGLGAAVCVTSKEPGREPEFSHEFGGGEPMSISLLAGSDSVLAKAFGKALFDFDSGVDPNQVEEQLDAVVDNPDIMSSALAKESPTEKDPPVDPELTREVEIKDLAQNMDRLMAEPVSIEANSRAVVEISRALGMPALYESYAGSMPVGFFLRKGKQPVFRVLAALEKAGNSWERGNGMLRIKPQDWALQRSRDVSESTMAYYKGLLDNPGYLTLDDLASIAASLTSEQLQYTVMADPDLREFVSGIALGIRDVRSYLQVYDSLSAQQKSQLKKGAELSFDQLTNPQWEALSNVITDQLGGVYVTGGTIRLHDNPSPEEAKSSYAATFSISVQVAGEDKPRTIKQIVRVIGKDLGQQLKQMRKKQQEQLEKVRRKLEEEAKEKRAGTSKPDTAAPSPTR